MAIGDHQQDGRMIPRMMMKAKGSCWMHGASNRVNWTLDGKRPTVDIMMLMKGLKD